MASIPSAYDSSASAVKFSSLQYAEEEIKIPIVNFDDPEVQRVAAKFTPEQRAWFMSRDKALEQLLWGKFEKKIQVCYLRHWMKFLKMDNCDTSSRALLT